MQAGNAGVSVNTVSTSTAGTNGIAEGDDFAKDGGSFTTTTVPSSPTTVPLILAPVQVLGVRWQTQKQGTRREKRRECSGRDLRRAALNAGTAQDLSAYHLLSARRPKHLTQHDKLASAVYDAAADTVTALTPKGGEIPARARSSFRSIRPRFLTPWAGPSWATPGEASVTHLARQCLQCGRLSPSPNGSGARFRPLPPLRIELIQHRPQRLEVGPS